MLEASSLTFLVTALVWFKEMMGSRSFRTRKRRLLKMRVKEGANNLPDVIPWIHDVMVYAMGGV
jgi:hypothetical protein